MPPGNIFDHYSGSANNINHCNIWNLLIMKSWSFFGGCILVRQLSNIFGMEVDMLDKSTKFFLWTAIYAYFQFLIGTTFTESVMAAILDFKMAADQNSFLAISWVLIHLHSWSKSLNIHFQGQGIHLWRLKRCKSNICCIFRK